MESAPEFKRDVDEETSLMSVPSPSRFVILVVDDHAWIRKIIAQALADEYVILTAATGKEALRVLDRIKVDMILSDLIMPEMGGLPMGYEVRRRFPDLPIVFISGHLDSGTFEQARALTPYYVTKPFGVEDLQNQVKDLLLELGLQK
ncbi:MAG: response regulator [Armatimonadetes bacterium]|nr:response regulator [Armatimonadota bacterium]